MKRWNLGEEQGGRITARHDFKDLRSQLRQTPELRKAAALAQAEEKAKQRIAGVTRKVVFK